jgi:hypothetical protein
VSETIQNLVGKWWEPCPLHPVERWSLITTFGFHVPEVADELCMEGRADPTVHTKAVYTRRRADIRQGAPPKPTLPVAAQPVESQERHLMIPSKPRPALVVGVLGPEVARVDRVGKPPSLFSRKLLVAPYFGARKTDKRAGFPDALIDRIRLCEYQQYHLDILPHPRGEESILRLDGIHPIGDTPEWRLPLGFRLAPQAAKVMQEWVHWSMSGERPKAGVIEDARTMLLELEK